MSNSIAEHTKYWRDNVFQGISAGKNEQLLFEQYLNSQDFSIHTVKAKIMDIRKFAQYFTNTNNEPFDSTRISTMDLTSFKRHLRETRGQAVTTVNRVLVTIRRYLTWLVSNGHLEQNPATNVKEFRQQPLAPKGMERSQIRKLLREVELRRDIRAAAIFNTFLHTGCRVSDLVQIRLTDVIINNRSGNVVFRNGKGNKERTVPLSLPARRAILQYLDVRPPVKSDILYQDERGDLTDIGVRALCDKYSAICGFKLTPHLLRHSMAHQFLKDNQNDIVALAQLLGHQNIQTTVRYTQRTQDALAEMSENIAY